MIASLTGTLTHLGANYAVLDVGGVGYQVQVTPTHSLELRMGTETTIITALIVREDALTLFGFRSFDERQIFEQLTTVSGVGPKSALAVITHLSPNELARAVETEDVNAFKPVSGVGPKTAKLIILQLKGKLLVHSEPATAPGEPAALPASVVKSADQVIDALVELGTKQPQAQAAVEAAAAELGEDADVPSLLRAALRELGRGGVRR
ncbi:Holliday junction branch migration protein RuvA [Gulosibacter molinativorax]|uniref:Holliday junction branch migration complex subunit RuvA n=1 Tax=Gulosibacter molinativorax TaxID=256821 RepID=A0ABT7C8S7_9MICO|nr:Holliday junction branch migration protein RuvA [Gulosibacter molinativorax]MDJ1371041.1 Holliday junction branch migration protein RuvA [Gulosibacter molinativorax]QUY61401.1 Holliday junction ATP-dependent DNA helicase RuvA [Gulosibacter molinativorax]